MTLTLTPDLERFVQDQVADGRFPSADGVVAAALHLLRSQHADLRDLVRLGLDQADRGEVAPFDPAATLARVKAGLPRAGG